MRKISLGFTALLLVIRMTSIPLSAQTDPGKRVRMARPNRVALGDTFIIDVWLDPPANKPTKVSMAKDEAISYNPPAFTLNGAQHKFIEVRVKSTQSGLAKLIALADGYEIFPESIDVTLGFRGQLTATEPSLSYHDPTTLTINIVDENGKPFPLVLPTRVELRSNALLKDLNPTWGNAINEEVPPGSTTVPQFQINPQKLTGGQVYLSANLQTSSGTVLAHKDFVYSASPSKPLTILLAIAGGLLHALWVYFKSRPKSPRKLFVTSALAGLIAWVFASVDPLNLKLDPSILQTYAVIGFLFSSVGIDVIFGKRFLDQNTPTKTNISG